jgi:signal transduction histidine kinase
LEKHPRRVYDCGVKRESELSAGGLRASIVLIVSTLVVIGIMQFHWFSRSASAEVEAAYRSLNATVVQAVSREYQRYAPILGELRSFRSQEPLPLEFLETFLKRIYDAYGPAGVTPKLLRSVCVVRAKDFSIMRTYGPSSDGWVEARGALSALLPDRVAEVLGSGELGHFAAKDSPRYLLSSPYPSSPYLLALELDSEGFFEGYVAPAVAGLLPDATLSWSKDFPQRPSRGGSGEVSADDEGREGPPVRRFNPLHALFGRGDASAATFSIRVSAELNPFFAPDGERGPGAPGAGAFRLIPIGMDGVPPIDDMRFRRLDVTLSRASSIDSVERRLSLNWLFGNLLLFGVGLAFGQAVVQRRRLGLVRQREREFVASVTHELRTPLTVIMSASDNLRGGLVAGERVAEYGELIAGQSRRLGAMIEEVLLYSRVEGREPGPPPLVPIDRARLEAELRGPLEELARGSGSRLEWDLSGLPATFMGDSPGIGLAISNLVANAAFHAYGKGSGGAVRVRGVTGHAATIIVQVEDDGRGIARSEAELVFEPFYRDEAARRRHEKGTGLGLFLARRKARSLGGDLRLESPYRRADGIRRSGCRFTLELPFEEVGDGA